MKRAYTRCNGGHYFQGAHCPFDGWSSAASRELTAALKKLTRLRRTISVEALRNLGVSEDTLERTIVVEFGSPTAAFEAIAPEDYVVDGKTLPLAELPDNLL